MRKYLYLIKKQKIKSWLKFWLMTNKQFTIVLSEILEGFSFNLQNTVKRYFKIFNIFGKSEQETGKSKNLFDYKQITPGTSRTIENGGFVINDTSFQNGDVIAKLKTLCPDLKVGDEFKFNWDTNATRNNSDVTYIYLSSYANTIRKDTLYTCTQTMLDSDVYFYGQQGEYYKNIMFYLDGQTSDYEPYGDKPSPSNPSEIHSVADDGSFTIDFEGQTENYNYTFITKPLRSLPNGVRDSLEADGIHRKIGIQTGTLSQTTTITLSDAKQNGAYMCNIKSAGTLTGQTIELEAGDYKIIYELAEEVIEPFTEEQQEQYNKIKELYTFDGTTNISSDDVVPPYLQIQYYMKGE